MANAPFTWGSQGPKSLQAGGVELTNGMVLRNDGYKNYITYNDASTGLTTGWSLGNASLTSNFPSGTPTFGSGADANLSFTVSTSGPLDGLQSYEYASSAATVAGDFLASDVFSVDLADKAKILSVSFAYELASGTADMSGTSSNSFGIAIYDVDATEWIMPAGVWNIVQTSGVGNATATFQTSSSSTQYRLVLFNANATSGAVSLKLDRFSVKTQQIIQGTPITDWQSYTPTLSAGFGTTTNVSYKWRRVGSQLEVVGTHTNGTLSAVLGTVSLPAGMAIDTTKVSISNTSANPGMRVGDFRSNGAAAAQGTIVTAVGTSTTQVYTAGIYTQSTPNTPQNVSTSFGTNGHVSIMFSVPIAGWSSQVQMSNDTDTRVVAAIISGDPASASSGNPIIVPTVTYDSHAAYNTTTGRYTCPVSGIYKIFGALQSASSATTLTIYKNAASAALAGSLDSNGEATFCAAVQCNAGDIIDLRPGGTVDATSITLNIERLSGPSVIAASETVASRYYASSTSLSGSLATIVWTTKDYDTHATMSSGLYTIPVTGKYRIKSQLTLSGTFALNTQTNIQIQKNSTAVSELNKYSAAAVTNEIVDIDDVISCKAGDVIRIQASCGATTPAIVSSNTKNYISIVKVGN